MKLAHHQKRLDDLQRDLIHSESESSKNRVELEKKDFEVHQLHRMLNRAEQLSEEMMRKYDDEVKKLTEKVSSPNRFCRSRKTFDFRSFATFNTTTND